MEAATARPGYELWRPNREKAEAKTMRTVVAFILVVSAVLLIVITIGGWPRLEGASVGLMTLLWAGLYILFAFLVMRWNRGILPVASMLAIILTIFAAIAAPAWFARSKDGLSPPPIPDDILGLLTILVIPAQLILIAVAMISFNQNWHVEEERPIGGVAMAGEDEPPPEYDETYDGEDQPPPQHDETYADEDEPPPDDETYRDER
jgi:hypothetical protein